MASSSSSSSPAFPLLLLDHGHRHLLPCSLSFSFSLASLRFCKLSSTRRRCVRPPRAELKGGGTAADEVEALPRQDGVGLKESEDEHRGIEGVHHPAQQSKGTAAADSSSLGIREPVYEVIEVKPDGTMTTKNINRRQLLKSSGLRPRDIRSVDPSLWLMNSMPCLLIREQAILLNFGSLRAIALHDRVLVFNYNSKGGGAFLNTLLPRLNPKHVNGGGPAMPFELEVFEAALISRIQRLEQRLIVLEPRVSALLEVLPNRLTADVLEQLRLSKQTLAELGSRAGDLKQMLLDLLEDPDEVRRMSIIGRNCRVNKGAHAIECSLPADKQTAEAEEEEIEMLLEIYLQRCESCHGQAERLLDSAKEMEDSIAVNLSSRRLEVSRVELLLQVGTFCISVGALVAGIFGMNLKSYLEQRTYAFWFTTTGIVLGAAAAFCFMYFYLKSRRIF